MYALVVARPTLCAPTTTHRSLSLSRASAPPLLKHSVIRAPLHPARASPPCTRPPPLPLHSTTPSAPAPHSCTCLSINLDPSTSARRSRRRPTARERVRTRGLHASRRRTRHDAPTTYAYVAQTMATATQTAGATGRLRAALTANAQQLSAQAYSGVSCAPQPPLSAVRSGGSTQYTVQCRAAVGAALWPMNDQACVL
eukprot:scaffold9108_cov152-Isochrysis_galbana.AAC.2